MSSVKLDAMHRMFVKMYGFRPPLPDFRVGDGVEVSYAQEIAEVSPLPVRGTIMSLSRKGIDAKFTIINSLDGEWYTATYTTSSPLLRGVKILQRNRVNEGLKPVRRAKLTYLKEADPVSLFPPPFCVTCEVS
jgi:ribosomal protein L19